MKPGSDPSLNLSHYIVLSGSVIHVHAGTFFFTFMVFSALLPFCKMLLQAENVRGALHFANLCFSLLCSNYWQDYTICIYCKLIYVSRKEESMSTN